MEPLPKKNVSHGVDACANIDRITHLPDHILHRIFSLAGFQIFDIVELSVLSKRWNHLWITMPYLDIDINKLYTERLEGVRVDCLLLAEKLKNFISWVLVRQGESKLVRFRLNSSSLFDDVQILRWLRTVAERNIQELDIKCVPPGKFILPLFIAVNESLRVLKLSLESQVMQLPSVVRLNQLRSIELNEIAFTGSDALQRLFFGCRYLESLRLNDCEAWNFTFLDFSSAHLKELIFDFTEHSMDAFSNFEIKVSCENLVFFKFSAPVVMNFILEKASSLETASIHFFVEVTTDDRQVGQMMYRLLKEVPNVNVLELGLHVVNGLAHAVDELICCPILLLKVRILRLTIRTLNHYTQFMFLLLNNCPNLEDLTIGFCGDDPEWDVEQWELQYRGIVSWKSQLKTVKFVKFEGFNDELDFSRFFLMNARSLETLEITWLFNSCRDRSVGMIEEVLMFPKASSKAVVTFLERPYYNFSLYGTP